MKKYTFILPGHPIILAKKMVPHTKYETQK